MGRAVEVIKEFITEYAAYKPAVGEIDMEPVFDDERGHYSLMMQGWKRGQRVHGVVVRVDVHGDRVLIQHDGTEEGIANRLVEAGIPHKQIVLCFQSPRTRAHTPFAVA